MQLFWRLREEQAEDAGRTLVDSLRGCRPIHCRDDAVGGAERWQLGGGPWGCC